MLEKKPNQCQKVLNALREARGEFVNGRYFKDNLMLSQFHARIWELQHSGHNIKRSPTRDEYGFFSYRIIEDGLELPKESMPNKDGVKTMAVESISQPGKKYTVAIFPSGAMECECSGYQYRRTCSHLQLIKTN